MKNHLFVGRRCQAAALALAFATVSAACRKSESEAVNLRAGTFEVTAALSPDPPRQQGNVLELTVRDRAGTPVDEAEVTVGYSMPAMGAMPAMKGKADVVPMDGGRYKASFDLPMGGSWSIDVSVRDDESSGSAGFELSVGRKGLTAVESAAGGQPGQSGEVAYYTCSMHPAVRNHDPGTCPICSMNLQPVTKEEVDTGVIIIDAHRFDRRP
jgi:Cu(I)/Ag(I) efflux system membrane fusion protein